MLRRRVPNAHRSWLKPKVTSPTTAEFSFTVTGGRGAYLGATGNGVIHCMVQPDPKTFSRVIEGSVAIPK